MATKYTLTAVLPRSFNSLCKYVDSRQAAPESFHATADLEGGRTFGSLNTSVSKR